MAKLHDVYWGSHGCKRTRGHANPCICGCKTTIADHPDVFFYGDDKATAVTDPRNRDMITVVR
jgi:hypothetical protein